MTEIVLNGTKDESRGWPSADRDETGSGHLQSGIPTTDGVFRTGVRGT